MFHSLVHVTQDFKNLSQYEEISNLETNLITWDVQGLDYP